MTKDEMLDALWEVARSNLWHDGDENSEEYRHIQSIVYRKWSKILFPVKRKSTDANGNTPAVVKLIKTLARTGEAYSSIKARYALPAQYNKLVYTSDNPRGEPGCFSDAHERLDEFRELAKLDGYYT